jgi:hypothetical protein
LEARGKKNKPTVPDVHLISFRGTNQPQIPNKKFLGFFLVRFGAFLGKGRPKTPQKHFFNQVHVENFSRKTAKNFDVSFPSTSFVLSRFWVFLSDGSSKALPKNITKKSRRKVCAKKSTKKSKTDFFSICFYLSPFWSSKTQ